MAAALRCCRPPYWERELQSNEAALRSLTEEADKLQARDTWDLKSVKEWSDAARDARHNGTHAHVGRMFPIVVENNAELPIVHPERKFKGRIFLGCEQLTEDSNATAISQDHATSPASLEASKILDACQTGQQNNGTQAFPQATLGTGPNSILTSARPPMELQPMTFSKYRDPVVIVRKALYGHPEAQSYLESIMKESLLGNCDIPSSSIVLR